MSRYELIAERFVTTNSGIVSFGKGQKPKLEDSKGNILNKKLVFYSGRFLLYDENTERLVILSYTTPEKKEFILRSLSRDGTLVWKIKQSSME